MCRPLPLVTVDDVRTDHAWHRALERLERAPAWVLVGAFVAGSSAVTGWMLAGYDERGTPLLVVLGAYTVAAYRPVREIVVAAAALGALLVLLVIGPSASFGLTELVATSGVVAVGMLIGWTAQSRRRRIEALERGQAEAALRAAADERLRIAQELHDVVAHSLGVIAVQAGVGMHVIDTDPAEARRSFAAISRTSRSSLAEIRGLLAVVRDPESSPAYTPVPGLPDLRRLVEDVTTAGLVVDMRVDGDVARVPRGVGLAAYRIVQEALTNTLRHARASRAGVHLDCTSEVLAIEVTDDGRGPRKGTHRGHGLIGMRERVAVYGGSLDIGPGSRGGYRVTVTLPFEAEPAP
jgi:signal transduction histidine kinase